MKTRLTREEIKELQKTKIIPTREQVLRSRCNHVKENGDDAVQYSSAEDMCKCSICGRKFKPLDIDISLENVKHYSQIMINTVETLKLLSDHLPDYIDYDTLCRTIPVIEKIPEIFRDTRKNFDESEDSKSPLSYQNQISRTIQNFLEKDEES